MNISRWRAVLFASTPLYALAIFVFLTGFLSVSVLNGLQRLSKSEASGSVSEGAVDPHDNPGRRDRIVTAGKDHLDKVVIFLIDALRLDFVTGNTSGLTLLHQRLRDGSAKGFLAKARTPTVTLPRLKVRSFGVSLNRT